MRQCDIRVKSGVMLIPARKAVVALKSTETLLKRESNSVEHGDTAFRLVFRSGKSLESRLTIGCVVGLHVGEGGRCATRKRFPTVRTLARMAVVVTLWWELSSRKTFSRCTALSIRSKVVEFIFNE